MARAKKERRSAIYAFLCDGEEVVLGKHVLVNGMHTAFLRRPTFSFAILGETGVSVLAIVPLNGSERVVAFLKVEVKEMGRGQILVTFCASIDVLLGIVRLVITI